MLKPDARRWGRLCRLPPRRPQVALDLRDGYPAGYAQNMASVDLTLADFEDTVTAPGITLVDFWAAWCGPCRMFGPIFDEASEDNPDIRFAKVDTEAEPEIAGGMGITSIPTLMAFRDGILVFSQAGALPKPSLDELINAVRALDMDQVRAEVAAQQELGD